MVIDFGLGYVQALPEDKAVDLYVLERAMHSTHPNAQPLVSVFVWLLFYYYLWHLYTQS